MENKRYVLKLKVTGYVLGEVGQETVLKDYDGTILHVGDIVECTCNGYTSHNFVCRNREYGDFILGIAMRSSSLYHNGKIVEWKVKKIRDYRDNLSRDFLYHNRVCVEQLDPSSTSKFF